MGGFGSGRPSSSRKPTAESMKRLDLARLRRDGSLRSGTASKISWSCGGQDAGSIGTLARGDALRLMYRAQSRDGSWYDVDETVHLAWTKTHFGGERVWFVCPGCARRCRVLFGGARFRCRTCHGVRYGSQAETKAGRAVRGMFKIVGRLYPKADFNELPPKPRGMHWRTYERLADRYQAYDDQWGIEAIRRFGMVPDF